MKKLLLLWFCACALQMYALAVPTGCKDPAGCNPELSCEGDGRFRSSCNWCRCVGGKSLCTKRGCPPGLAERLESEPDCEGNVTFHRECNTCSCVNGRAVCTTKHCGTPGPQSAISVTVTEERDQRSPTDTEPECTPGSRWRANCNWCSCNELGLGVCTKKGCPPVPTDEQRNEPDCEGASRWREDCNWCSCIDGRGLCTLKACEVDKALPPPSDTSVSNPSEIPKPPEREIMCTNGSRYRDQCNWCSCTASGVAICTMMGCPPEIMEHFKNEPECIGDSRWKRDCNWCNCLNGNAVCTLKECVLEFDESSVVTRDGSKKEPLCTKGSEWREHCNWCSCSETGTPHCTEKACLMPPEEIKDPECKGNAQWYRDCNWCSCEEGRAVCTERACVGDASDTCVEGAVWHVGCNSCVCRNGRSLCTEKDCRPDGSTCLPNTRWKDDCNNCFCGDSRQPVCTKMLCTRPSHCYLPPIELDGPLCEGFQRKWTFDSSARQCKSIVYGGCGGTANLFDSEFDCLTSCLFPLGEGSLKKGSGVKDLGVTRNQKRCLLPVEEGPCFGALPYFFYNKVTGKCESFTYGGCRGNANRFHSLEECQETCAGIAPATDETCDRSQCPWKRWGHYLAKGCLPQYDSGACCPTRFSCSSYDESLGNKTQCFYRNRAYDIGERLEVSDDCSAGCLCAESYSAESPEILCASVECPDLFRPHPPGCRPLYRLGQCCAYDYDCADSQSPTGLETRAQTCFWNNRTYHEGDQMYFDKYPCQRCICGSDFTDPFGPGCVKIDCGFEFRYTNRYDRGCVPIFFKENCCPIDWLCPGDSRITELEDDIMEDEDRRGDQCHLGTISLEVGKSLQLSNCEIDCRCITPPEFTCTMLDNCEAVTETQSYKDCPEISCSAECTPLTDTLSGCLTCSCKNQSFTCPELQCSPSCGTRISYETGCPECSCQCPVASGQTPCPDECTMVRDSNGCPVSCECNLAGFGFSSFDNCTEDPHCPENCTVHKEAGCAKCECNSSHFGNSTKITRRQVQCSQNPPCPQDCAVIRQIDQNTGCLVCICDPINPGNPFVSPPLRPPRTPRRCPSGRPPCPQDCAVRYVINRNTGCLVCTCIRNSGNPFTPVRPPYPTRQCPLGPDGRPPCPQDCAVIQTVDQNTGCRVCICDPNDTGNPLVPVNPPPPNPFQTCPTGPDGNPPCPQDCGVIQTVDKNTGCRVCICDPNDTGNPFGPLNPPPPPTPPPTRSCPTNPDGKPPCPQDCGVIQTVDKNTGCAICICDPNDTGNPFGPLNPPPPPTRSCPTNPDGKPPCPQDCGVIQTVDKNTGCAICICDPNDTGFGPFNPPPPPPPPSSG